MSQYIQSKIELFHTFEEQKPTETKDETEVKANPEDVGFNEKKGTFEARGIEKKLGTTAMRRRIVNVVAQTTEQAVSRYYDERIFRSSLAGDRRSMIKNQETQAKLKGSINTARGFVGAGITSIALSNVHIMTIFLAGEVVSRGQMFSSQTQQLNHYNILRDKEMFEARKRQDRLIVGTFNRRG